MRKKSKKSIIKGTDSVSQLQRAVLRFVEEHGGRIIVIGGGSVMVMPSDRPQNFYIAVKCTGSRPELPVRRSHEKA